RPAMTDVTEVAVAIHRDDRYLLLKRKAGERWAGLWDFVRLPVEEKRNEKRKAESGKRKGVPGRGSKTAGGDLALSRMIADEFGVAVEIGERLAVLRHGVTRYRITLHCRRAEWLSGEPNSGREFAWVP